MVWAYTYGTMVNLDRYDKICSSSVRETKSDFGLWLEGSVCAETSDELEKLYTIARRVENEDDRCDAFEEIDWCLNTFIRMMAELISKGNAGDAHNIVVDCDKLRNEVIALWKATPEEVQQ